jgi:RimJ/RimL family protein N-acetyltransferase
MTHPDIRAALGHERLNTLLADAEAARTARQTRLHRRQAATSARRGSPLRRRAMAGTRAVLRDGSAVAIRQVHSSDAPLLADGFARLSAESRRMRFLRPKNELSQTELRYFTQVDHHDHEALGALDDRTGRGVGVARYVRHDNDPQTAEIAVTVVDAWQSRGLGTELLATLADRARAEGIQRFTALVAADNAAAAGLLHSMRAHLIRRNPGTAEYQISLSPGRDGPHKVTGDPEDEPGRWAPARLAVTPTKAEVPQSSPADGLTMTRQAR